MAELTELEINANETSNSSDSDSDDSKLDANDESQQNGCQKRKISECNDKDEELNKAIKTDSNDVVKHEELEDVLEEKENPSPTVSEPDSYDSMDEQSETEEKMEEDDNEETSGKVKRAELKARKVTNLRKNIKDVIDETQLDASTLAAQREESERLARVQEQQRLLRETQRQIAMEKFSRDEEKVLQFLQGQPVLEKSDAEVTISKVEKKNDLTEEAPSISITSISRKPETKSSEIKKDVVTIVDSSSDDDCIVLSDDDEIEQEDDEDPHNSGLHTNDLYNVPDDNGRVLVNVGHAPDEPDLFLAPQIARIVKPHQIGGIRFLFDNIIESTSRYTTSTGFGCILAHSMGLGKTLQVISFCDIFLRHTCSKTILIIMPINTLQNWLSEFNMWLPDAVPEDAPHEIRPREFKVFVLNDNYKTLASRAEIVFQWLKEGGVLMIGYEMYRLLSMKKMAKKKRRIPIAELMSKEQNEEQKEMFDAIHEALVCPGPDLVICDEGHRIKNAHASISVALKQIKSKRRIVLTGYPLQNNLLEYWCMVDFVRPNYLGTKTEFSNMFERPIQNGQCIDSTPQDIKLMRYRAHVLHSLLVGFVQRRSHLVLQATLPQKQEYVLLVRMTSFQRKLYEKFMNDVVRTKAVPNPLKAFSVCCKIWNHPDVLYNFIKKREADLDLELDETLETASTVTGSSQSGSTTPKKRGRKSKKDMEKEKITGEIKSAPVETPIKNPSPPSTINKEPSMSTPQKSETQPNDYYHQGYPPYNAQYSSYPCHSNPSAYSESSNYYNSTYYPAHNQPPTNSNYQTNFNQNYWQNNGYYNQDYRTPYYNQMPYQKNASPSWFDSKSSVGTPQWGTSNTAPELPKNDSVNNVKPEEQVEKRAKSPEVLLPSTIEDNKLAEEIKEEVEGNTKPKDDSIPYDWAVELLKGYIPDLLENSPKMEIFFYLLEESVRQGDRILLFSQSLLTLNVIEKFLQKTKIPNTDTCWMKNVSYFRLDGSTVAQDRERLINEFNSNSNVHLFLVSTRAGSLGINLVGANRVVVFDASWNPCHDTQAVCRVYRYGQQKPCFVYRIVMDGCLEKKIYDRQINKQGMSDRVVDECNPDAHLSMKEITSLCWDDDEIAEVQDFSEFKDEYKDDIVKKLLENYSPCLSKKPFQHESLLVDRKEKKLSSAEKRLAQRGYEMEKQASTKPTYTYVGTNTSYRAYRTPDGSLIHKPVHPGRPSHGEIGADRMMPRNNVPRPTRWIPAEVWQRQGMMAQEMTLPQDVIIPTSSQDKENIVLKAGERVMILRSTKGIYMQLETGKIIAIRTTNKPGQGTMPPLSDQQSNGQFQNMPGSSKDSAQQQPKSTNNSSKTDEVHNISDDDECVMTSVTYPNDRDKQTRDFSSYPSTSKDLSAQATTKKVEIDEAEKVKNLPDNPAAAVDETPVREKVVYKPNLIPRKSRPAHNVTEGYEKNLDNFPRADNNRSYPTSNGNPSSDSRYQSYQNRGPMYGSQMGPSNSYSHAVAPHFSSYRENKPSNPYPSHYNSYLPTSTPNLSQESYGYHPYNNFDRFHRQTPSQPPTQPPPPLPPTHPVEPNGDFYNFSSNYTAPNNSHNQPSVEQEWK